ncbi:MAG: ADP,ATP carrier protein 1 [Chlamydiae bacterium]|nr:ADP,ATP carrier protein 1 [Chlamydiota bacterium]
MKRSTSLITLCFLICLNYYILRNLKDSLVLTEALSGTEAIPFLKTWALIPGTIFFVALTVWLSNRIKFSTLFLLAISFCTSFYALFTFFLYPLGDSLLPHAFADRLQSSLPDGWIGFVSMIRYWPSSLFYVMAEIWTIIIWYILFTGFANEILKAPEAKIQYPWIILAGNLSAFTAGIMVPMLTSPNWDTTLTNLTTFLILTAIIIGVVFVKIEKSVKQPISHPYKMSFSESFKSIFKSRYLLCLAFMVFGFNLLINLTEVVWKDEVLKVFPHPSDYNVYMNKITGFIGILSAGIMILIIRLQRMDWISWALVTPAVTLGSALIFFLPLMFSLSIIPPLLMGSLHVILSRSTRYTLFDYTKELALIPLPSDQKFKAKTQIDGVGSRLGKGVSSGVFQGTLLFVPTISACAPVIFGLIVAITVLSVMSIRLIGREMETAK